MDDAGHRKKTIYICLFSLITAIHPDEPDVLILVALSVSHRVLPSEVISRQTEP